MIAALAWQARMVLPYTFLWRRQVRRVREKNRDALREVSILVSNVLTPNSAYHKLIEQVQQHQPDMLLTLESDSAWQRALAVLHDDYPHRVAVPLDNLYGMHLYSRLPLHDIEVKYLFNDEVPSIHGAVELRSGERVNIHCLHPEPPSPTEADDSTLRDAEILLIGNALKDQQQSTIVMGDLNDVAWSRTTRLFQKVSGLLDPRIGRYFINTFHAQYPFARWALDHLFHSADFGLITMKRLPNIGSDHFPVLTVLQLCPVAEAQQEVVEADTGDEQEAQARIQEGREQAAAEGHNSEQATNT